MAATQLPPSGGLLDLDVIARKLAEPNNNDIRGKIQMADHLRDNYDTRTEAETKRYVELVMPVILDLLKNGKPVLQRDGPDRPLPEQTLRHTLLDLCQRHPPVDQIRPTIPELCKTLLHLMRNDNEENAVTALKIFQELVRANKQTCDMFFQPFIEFVTDLYTGMDTVVNDLFPESDAPATEQTALVPGLRSFKVAVELPIAVIYACNLNKEVGYPALQQLSPHIIHFMQLEAPSQRKARADLMPDSGELLIGPCAAITNKSVYQDFLHAQSKGISFTSYIVRTRQGPGSPLLESLATIIVRLLQDLSPDQIHTRRELLAGLRTITASEARAALTPYIDLLIQERVVLGDGLGSADSVRSYAIGAVSDAVHQARNELSKEQVTRILRLLCSNLHNETISGQIQTMISKVLTNLTEVVKDRFEPAETTQILFQLLRCFVDKIATLTRVRATWTEMKIGKSVGDPDGPTGAEFGLIDRAKPVGTEWWLAVDNIMEVLMYCRSLMKVILMACKNLITQLKALGGPQPDGELMGKLFLDSMAALSLFNPPPAVTGPTGIPEEKEVLDLIAELLRESRPLVFQEIWTRHMPAFVEQLTIHPPLIYVAHELLRHDATSPTLVALFLKFLLQHLDELGNLEQRDAHNYVRLFKITFQGVTQQPGLNEKVLAPYLPRLVLDSLQLAGRAKRPDTYYILVRGLFRAIGGSPGRFEHVYKEVLPLLQEMFETLNRQLALTRPDQKEMRTTIVELCLTIPVRLTHLVPHLRHLMQPLVHSLSGPADIASQGLRTLELCIDNLQPEFIDPPLRPVLPTLIRALNEHLKPLPTPSNLSHTTLRILGKLGGKNRLLLHEPPQVEYKTQVEPVVLGLPFGNRRADVQAGPVAKLTTAHLNSTVKEYRDQAFDLAKNLVMLQIEDSSREDEGRSICLDVLRGMITGLSREEDKDKITDFLRSFGRHVCLIECLRDALVDQLMRRPLFAYASAFFEAVIDAVAAPQEDISDAALSFLRVFVEDIQQLKTAANGKEITSDMRAALMLHLAFRAANFCHSDTWQLRQGGARALHELVTSADADPEKGRWLGKKETDFAGALWAVLKNAPLDQQSPDALLDTCKASSLVCCRKAVDNVLQIAPPPAERDSNPSWKMRFDSLCTMLATELSCGSSRVREAASEALGYLAKTFDRTVSDLVQPYRQRILHHLLSVPLRTLPLQKQIENMDAMTFLLSMETPIQPENMEELLRALHEAIGLADADDQALVSRSGQRQSMVLANSARVSGIRLTTASLPVTEFYAKHPQSRQRVVGVYFKALYAAQQPIKQAAKDGLQALTSSNQRLPRDFLQSGLRPILTSLSETSKLTAQGLDGLAQLMELLTNYFRVELGQRLVHHYKTLSDPATFRVEGAGLVSDNDSLIKLVGLVNIFHLLPQTANMYLPELLDEVVKTEALLLSAAPTCLSAPLGKYLNRYPAETADIFVSKLEDLRYVRTLRNVIQSGSAPSLVEELGRRTTDFIVANFSDETHVHVLSTLEIMNDLLAADPAWLSSHAEAYEALLALWRGEFTKEPSSSPMPAPWIRVGLQVFVKALKHDKRVDVLLQLFLVHGHGLALDLSELNHFVHEAFITSSDVEMRRTIVTEFMSMFAEAEPTRTPAWHLERLLHGLVIPVVLASFLRNEPVVDASIIHLLADHMWKPIVNSQRDDNDRMQVGILALGSIVIQHAPDLLAADRKEIVRAGWQIQQQTDDPIVRHWANIYLCRFYDAFESPAKFVLSTLAALVRMQGVEVRSLARQALDILVPALPKRLPPDDSHWARMFRRTLIEDSGQWTLIYGLVSRHKDVFYPHRQLLVPHMVGCLHKHGLSPFAHIDGKQLSLDLVDVLTYWERKAASEMVDDKPPWQMSPATINSVVHYLTRSLVMAIAHEVQQTPGHMKQVDALHARALGYLKEIFGPNGWSTAEFKLDTVSKYLMAMPELAPSSHQIVVNHARMLNVIVAEKHDDWIRDNAKELMQIIQRPLTSDDVAMQDNLMPVFRRLIKLFPPRDESAEDEPPSDANDFHSLIETAVGDGLKTATSPRGSILMLEALVEVSPRKLEPFAPNLNKLLAKYVRDSTSTSPQTNADATLKMLRTTLNINRLGVSYLFDQRKNLLTSLVYLLEKQVHVPTLEYLLDMVREWVLSNKEAYPTMKEKANLILKMLAFEGRGEKLWTDYLQLVYDIYDDPALRRTDLTQRLEPGFFVGCRAKDPTLRWKFIDKLQASIGGGTYTRLSYVFAVHNWDPLAEYNWIHIALELLLGSVDADQALATPQAINALGEQQLLDAFASRRVGDLTGPLQRLLYTDPSLTQSLFVAVFPAIWSTLSRKEQTELGTHVTVLLTREYHSRQAELRPNVVQAVLDALHACAPPIAVPPFLLKHLGKTFGAWHTAISMLERSVESPVQDDETVRQNCVDSLIEMYADLGEDDMFYGAWRTRNLYADTNQAITFEQHGMWYLALQHYENAMTKARHGQQNYTEQEYALWEDHYVLAMQKMQMWDQLRDLAKNLDDKDLWLESLWRQQQGSHQQQSTDWNRERELIDLELRNLSNVATPRRKAFEAFLALQKAYPNDPFKNSEFPRITDEANQLVLRKWVSLPSTICSAHLPLLQHCQQFVELAEAANIFTGLANTNTTNLEKKSSELKHTLFTWRERLPNLEDDIEIWSDLVNWRQHVFEMINQAYVPLIQASGNAPGANASTVGYRGYHETAWTINRYAATARKHFLLEVCHSALNRIYTLPNIEIAEAFRKLREQARCYYQTPSELQQGLEVINNTNLTFFSMPQKAEFFTLKGMFFHKLGRNEEACDAFSQAVNQDSSLYKAWAEWASYHDTVAQESHEVDSVVNALSCYMIAASLTNTRSTCRPFLTRILWLLSLDDGTFGTSLEQKWVQERDKLPLWYFLPLIPQLLALLPTNAIRYIVFVLISVARSYPQAVFYHVRSYRDELLWKRQIQMRQMAAANQATAASASSHPASPVKVEGQDGDAATSSPQTHAPSQPQPPQLPPLMPHEKTIEELYSLIKSTHPLLHITLERTVEAWSKCKEAPDEFACRLLNILISSALETYNIQNSKFGDTGAIDPKLLANAHKASLSGPMVPRWQQEFQNDILKNPPATTKEFIKRLQAWRDRFEKPITHRSQVLNIEHVNMYLASFQTSQFHDIEVPGQYMRHVDNNHHFVKASHFHPKVTAFRGIHCYHMRRFRIIGHDGSEHAFFVQPLIFAQHRQEERVQQIFRAFNDVVATFKETRRRGLSFFVPVMVPLSSGLRLVNADDSFISLQDIHDDYLERKGYSKESLALTWAERFKEAQDPAGRELEKPRATLVRIEILNEITNKHMPVTVLSEFISRTMANPTDLWLMRKQFTKQLSALSFMHYTTGAPSRTPSRIYFSRRSGQIFEHNLNFAYVQGKPLLYPGFENVPWRFTPNIQHFVGRIATEGLFTTCMVALGRALTEPDFKLDRTLQLFLKDDMLQYLRESLQQPRIPHDAQLEFLRNGVLANVHLVVQRTEHIACKDAWDKVIQQGNQTAVQPVVTLVSESTKLQSLANMKHDFYPWF